MFRVLNSPRIQVMGIRDGIEIEFGTVRNSRTELGVGSVSFSVPKDFVECGPDRGAAAIMFCGKCIHRNLAATELFYCVAALFNGLSHFSDDRQTNFRSPSAAKFRRGPRGASRRVRK